MKIDKKYIVIAVCILIGGVLTATLAFIGPDIITNGTINPNNVVTGNLKLKITDTSVNINNMAPIRSSNYETEAFKKEFTISNAESTLNGCMKLYLNFNSISDTLKSEYLVYKVVSSTGNISEGSFKDIADNKLLIYDSDFIESSKSITYTLYIWLRYVEDSTINLASLLGTSVNAYVSVNGTDTKESTSCKFDSSKKISYVVTFMNTDNKTVLETRKVSSGSVLGNLPSTRQYFTKTGGNGTEYTSTSTINDDVMLYNSTFEYDTWSEIVANVKAKKISQYNVGDTKSVNLGTYGTHTLRIANTSTPSECSTSGFSQTACGFVLEFADIITTHKMNDTSTNVGGWPASSMYTFVNNDIYNAIPEEIKDAIIDTTVVSGHGKSNTENFTSTDKLYLLSTAEVWSQGSSNTISDDAARDVTRQLDYYKNLGTSTTNRSGAVKKSGYAWWLRVANSSDNNNFFRVNNRGDWSNNNASTTNGVSPAFRLR
ncbi:MAG: DUF6273 domain-containing protein [Clostridium sp.]|nr:DUF6273 domain-containing protein [Clostridium sp.]